MSEVSATEYCETQVSSQRESTNPFASRLQRWLMPALASCLILAVMMSLGTAKHWSLVHDAALMHYVTFLMDHGKAPYRDIIDMNMPGTYMIEWLVMHAIGGDVKA